MKDSTGNSNYSVSIPPITRKIFQGKDFVIILHRYSGINSRTLLSHFSGLAMHSRWRCSCWKRSGFRSKRSFNKIYQNHWCYRKWTRWNTGLCTGTKCCDSWFLHQNLSCRWFSSSLRLNHWKKKSFYRFENVFEWGLAWA